MKHFRKYLRHTLPEELLRIWQEIYVKVGDLDVETWWSKEPLPFEERKKGKHRKISVGEKWGELFDCVWFLFKGTVPKELKGKKTVLLIDVNGELCVFDDKGVPKRGLTTLSSDYDRQHGEPGKQVYNITKKAEGGEKIKVWADAGCNDLFGNIVNEGILKKAYIAECREDVRKLYYDFEFLLDLAQALGEDDPFEKQISNGLHEVSDLLYEFNTKEIKAADKILAPLLKKESEDNVLEVSAIGHSHLDLAWLWPIRETIRKGARTFSTVIDLMKKYPDYVYGSSQPQLFLWIKENYPELYSEIKKLVKQGRFELQGAMWVEADTNLSSGESLVRQLLHGKRFFKEEFGVEINNLWLPDVFGYSAAMPQILKKAGVKYFMTQKLSWNKINVFPHHSFKWQGLDGSQVLSHMLPENTYNSGATPHTLMKNASEYRNIDVSDKCLTLFGIGDGGGGPGLEHLERLDRAKNMYKMPKVTQRKSSEFFDEWEKDADKFPVWFGELYLEMHQGTFTTQAKNKWFNRKIEFALREAELAAVQAYIFLNEEYPREFFDKTWKEYLLYQFHDILPGSSIPRVYEESVERYEIMLDEIEEFITSTQSKLAQASAKSPCTKASGDIFAENIVFNSLPWDRSEWVAMNDSWKKINVPAMSFAEAIATEQSSYELKFNENKIENEKLKIKFDKNGAVSSLYDKELKKEFVAKGEKINKFAVYRDNGDAWDFPLNYADSKPDFMELVKMKTKIIGPFVICEQLYEYKTSSLKQQIVISADSKRIDFNTELSWNENKTMLRAVFPVNLLADEATYEIQFGHVKRPTHNNTSWDLAKSEVPAQKWADLSQGDCGIAILNDSKYGHKIKNGVMELNLLRSVPYPDKANAAVCTDQQEHEFSYALLPHAEDPVSAKVAKHAYEFNCPLRVLPAVAQKKTKIDSSFLFKVNPDNIIIESAKLAESSDNVILRLYESERKGTESTLSLSDKFSKAYETNLMEEKILELKIKKSECKLKFKPFEIKTVMLKK